MKSRKAAMDELLRIADAVTKVVLAHYEASSFSVELKGPNDPVTTADKEANEALLQALQGSFPGVPIVAEESDPSTFGAFATAPHAFFVDPIDGTKEFIGKHGDFSTMIGLVEDGVPILGVVAAPALQRVWFGGDGIGAFCRVGGADVPLTPSRVTALDDARLVLSRSHRTPEGDSRIRAFGLRHLIPRGSAGIKAVLVAEGEADLFIHPSRAGKRWDTCAPEAIAVAAGCAMTDTDGNRFDYRTTDIDNERGIVTANPALHATVLSRFKALREAQVIRS
jgi:3'(2'), 5'-bisphosphate nucleotidase